MHTTVTTYNTHFDGEVFLKERNNTWNTPFLFNGKELDEETGLYCYGARYYNPRISLWYGVDPLAEKRPHMSPYNYCSWNPIMKIDPDGRDEWELNKKGEEVNRIKNDKHDSFHIVDTDANGNILKDNDGNSIRTASTKDFDKGTVEGKRSQSSQYDDRNTGQKELTSIDIYEIRGDDDATEIFEFVANNTDVEWSQFMTGEAGDKGLNFLTTGHIEYTEPGAGDLYMGQLYDGYTIREHTHSHPYNPFPSGLIDRDKDIGFVAWLANDYTTRHSRNAPEFKIFFVPGKRYISYNQNSVRSDF